MLFFESLGLSENLGRYISGQSIWVADVSCRMYILYFATHRNIHIYLELGRQVVCRVGTPAPGFAFRTLLYIALLPINWLFLGRVFFMPLHISPSHNVNYRMSIYMYITVHIGILYLRT